MRDNRRRGHHRDKGEAPTENKNGKGRKEGDDQLGRKGKNDGERKRPPCRGDGPGRIDVGLPLVNPAAEKPASG